MVLEIPYEEMVSIQDKQFIDVRSEAEFIESHIPGAINVPLFNNAERAHIGTVYKQTGQNQAKELGLQIASAKLPELVAKIREHAGTQNLIIYCWRGGMRSKSVSTITDLMGMPTYRLSGGYRGYRTYITTYLTDYQLPGKCILIHGMTGCGKSTLVGMLAADGEPVINLERLAAHRGSAFGAIGETPHNQRTFDSLLVEQLQQVQGSPYFIMESKSQRIGKSRIPDFLWDKKFDAVHILLNASLETRVERLMRRYVTDDTELKDKVASAYQTIDSKLSPEDRKSGWLAIEESRYADLTRMVLVKYYDPRYSHARSYYPGELIPVSVESFDECKLRVKQICAKFSGE